MYFFWVNAIHLKQVSVFFFKYFNESPSSLISTVGRIINRISLCSLPVIMPCVYRDQVCVLIITLLRGWCYNYIQLHNPPGKNRNAIKDFILERVHIALKIGYHICLIDLRESYFKKLTQYQSSVSYSTLPSASTSGRPTQHKRFTSYWYSYGVV